MKPKTFRPKNHKNHKNRPQKTSYVFWGFLYKHRKDPANGKR